jgi:hypothetical protein
VPLFIDKEMPRKELFYSMEDRKGGRYIFKDEIFFQGFQIQTGLDLGMCEECPGFRRKDNTPACFFIIKWFNSKAIPSKD